MSVRHYDPGPRDYAVSFLLGAVGGAAALVALALLGA